MPTPVTLHLTAAAPRTSPKSSSTSVCSPVSSPVSSCSPAFPPFPCIHLYHPVPSPVLSSSHNSWLSAPPLAHHDIPLAHHDIPWPGSRYPQSCPPYVLEVEPLTCRSSLFYGPSGRLSRALREAFREAPSLREAQQGSGLGF